MSRDPEKKWPGKSTAAVGGRQQMSPERGKTLRSADADKKSAKLAHKAPRKHKCEEAFPNCFLQIKDSANENNSHPAQQLFAN